MYEESTRELAHSLTTLEGYLAKDPDLKNSLEEKEAQLRDLLGVKEKIEKIERYLLLVFWSVCVALYTLKLRNRLYPKSVELDALSIFALFSALAAPGCRRSCVRRRIWIGCLPIPPSSRILGECDKESPP